MAYRRHRFVDEAMGEEAVATTLKSGEAVLDMLLRELTKTAANRSARNFVHQGDQPQAEAPAVETELSAASDARSNQGSDALREIEAALMTLSARSKRH
jgi:hypothetical protein